MEVVAASNTATSWIRVHTTHLHTRDFSRVSKHMQHVPMEALIGPVLFTSFSVEEPPFTPVSCHGKNPGKTFLLLCLTGFELGTSCLWVIRLKRHLCRLSYLYLPAPYVEYVKLQLPLSNLKHVAKTDRRPRLPFVRKFQVNL